MADNLWGVLSLIITVVLGPVVMHFLNRRQTKEIKTELQAGAATLTSVEQTVAKTEVLVNGDRAAKEARIKELEAKLREHGLDA